MSTEMPKRRWYQFSLKTLLAVMTVATVAFGSWVQYGRYRAQENRDRVAAVKESVSAIEELGGKVTSEDKVRRPQTWMENLFDDPGGADDPVRVLEVTEVSFFIFRFRTHRNRIQIADGVTDNDLEHLRALTKLESIDLGNSNITDAGLEHLKRLTNLETLFLGNTQITDIGLEHLKGLANLQYLHLSRTSVTAAGLEHLKGMKRLKVLVLFQTNVTDDAVKKLQLALPNCKIMPPDPSRKNEDISTPPGGL